MRRSTYATLSGKVATVAYPSGLALKYTYNAYGYQSEIADNGSGQVYWTANARDQFLHLINETAGNGVVTTRTFSPQTGWVSTIQAGSGAAVANFSYSFDLVGNLTQRVDSALSRTDGFTYDALTRLSTYSIAGGATQTMGYDALGDITSKPGIRAYNYPAAVQARPQNDKSAQNRKVIYTAILMPKYTININMIWLWRHRAGMSGKKAVRALRRARSAPRGEPASY